MSGLCASVLVVLGLANSGVASVVTDDDAPSRAADSAADENRAHDLQAKSDVSEVAEAQASSAPTTPPTSATANMANGSPTKAPMPAQQMAPAKKPPMRSVTGGSRSRHRQHRYRTSALATSLNAPQFWQCVTCSMFDPVVCGSDLGETP